jgi:hypothetical protein
MGGAMRAAGLGLLLVVGVSLSVTSPTPAQEQFPAVWCVIKREYPNTQGTTIKQYAVARPQDMAGLGPWELLECNLTFTDAFKRRDLLAGFGSSGAAPPPVVASPPPPASPAPPPPVAVAPMVPATPPAITPPSPAVDGALTTKSGSRPAGQGCDGIDAEIAEVNREIQELSAQIATADALAERGREWLARVVAELQSRWNEKVSLDEAIRNPDLDFAGKKTITYYVRAIRTSAAEGLRAAERFKEKSAERQQLVTMRVGLCGRPPSPDTTPPMPANVGPDGCPPNRGKVACRTNAGQSVSSDLCLPAQPALSQANGICRQYYLGGAETCRCTWSGEPLQVSARGDPSQNDPPLDVDELLRSLDPGILIAGITPGQQTPPGGGDVLPPAVGDPRNPPPVQGRMPPAPPVTVTGTPPSPPGKVKVTLVCEHGRPDGTAKCIKHDHLCAPGTQGPNCPPWMATNTNTVSCHYRDKPWESGRSTSCILSNCGDPDMITGKDLRQSFRVGNSQVAMNCGPINAGQSPPDWLKKVIGAQQATLPAAPEAGASALPPSKPAGAASAASGLLPTGRSNLGASTAAPNNDGAQPPATPAIASTGNSTSQPLTSTGRRILDTSSQPLSATGRPLLYPPPERTSTLLDPIPGTDNKCFRDTMNDNRIICSGGMEPIEGTNGLCFRNTLTDQQFCVGRGRPGGGDDTTPSSLANVPADAPSDDNSVSAPPPGVSPSDQSDTPPRSRGGSGPRKKAGGPPSGGAPRQRVGQPPPRQRFQPCGGGPTYVQRHGPGKGQVTCGGDIQRKLFGG